MRNNAHHRIARRRTNLLFSGVYAAKPHLPDLGAETIIISKIDTYGTPQNRTYRVWGELDFQLHKRCEWNIKFQRWYYKTPHQIQSLSA